MLTTLTNRRSSSGISRSMNPSEFRGQKMSEMQTGRQARSLSAWTNGCPASCACVRAFVHACVPRSRMPLPPHPQRQRHRSSSSLPPSLAAKARLLACFPHSAPLPSPPLTRLEGQILRQSGDGDEDGDGKEDRRRTHPSCVSSNHSSPSPPRKVGTALQWCMTNGLGREGDTFRPLGL